MVRLHVTVILLYKKARARQTIPVWVKCINRSLLGNAPPSAFGACFLIQLFEMNLLICAAAIFLLRLIPLYRSIIILGTATKILSHINWRRLCSPFIAASTSIQCFLTERRRNHSKFRLDPFPTKNEVRPPGQPFFFFNPHFPDKLRKFL